MNRVKDTFNRFWTRARGFGRRRRGRRGDGGEKRTKSRGNGAWRLIPLAGALAVSAAVFAILTRCEYGAYALPLFRASWCGAWTQAFGFLSTSAGVGFLVFLTAEVVIVILAQFWKDRQIDRAERRAEAAERQADAAARQAETAERQAETAERMVELMEQARREDAERAERREEAAERRESMLIELIESLKNGRDDGAE